MPVSSASCWPPSTPLGSPRHCPGQARSRCSLPPKAFSQLAEPLPTEPEALQAVLLYHVVEDNLNGFDLMGMSSVPTAQGTDLPISVEQGEIVLNGSSTVTIANVLGSNGTAHVVNAVLIPPG
jgi:uncharacterized surface protein with fasciclin (FAS1) repeats